MQRGDVLKRNENVSVQFEMRNALDATVGGQRSFLVFAAEELDLDLLALVFARVILNRSLSLVAP
jgi:hypothetical protein